MEYPYIQSKHKIEKGICELCKIEKQITRLEWRVDWFQGNCEFEDICQSCFDRRNAEEKRKQDAYIEKMTPIWDKQLKQKQEKEQVVKGIISELGLDLKEYNNGQWAIGNKIDWWTTTGTAIERKSRKQHHFSFNHPQKIKEVLLSIS